MSERDVERNYTVAEFAAKLRRLADALEAGKPFRIQVAGERFTVPKNAAISVEHERGEGEEEVEFQLKWSLADVTDEAGDEDDEV
jgi:amphi-Trp domain-containing protein